MNNYRIEKYPDEIALTLYEKIKDLDFSDYEEEKEKEIEELTNALYYLKTICENELNKDYFRTLYKALERL